MTATEYRQTEINVQDVSLNKQNLESRETINFFKKALKKSGVKRNAKEKISYADLYAKLRETHDYWDDPDFLPETKSINPKFKVSNWKRAYYIKKGEEELFVSDKPSRKEANQNFIGNSGFMAALTSIINNKWIFINVVPEFQDFKENYIYAFRFRFFRFGEWHEVIVDDRIPTYDVTIYKLGTFYANFYHDERYLYFWPVLAEKAYAKFCGTYEDTCSVSMPEALDELTGGISEILNLNERDRPADLYNLMNDSFKLCQMGAYIEPNYISDYKINGLFTNHYYYVVEANEMELKDKTKAKVVLLGTTLGMFHPYTGAMEWKTKVEVLDNQPDAGEFYMKFNDFENTFSHLVVCHLSINSVDTEADGALRYDVYQHEGSWVKNVSAGGSRKSLENYVMNPQYRFQVFKADRDNKDGSAKVTISLTQVNDEMTILRKFHIIGYDIYSLKDSDPKLLDKQFFKANEPIISTTAYFNLREIRSTHKLPIGCYVIVPSTLHLGAEGQFILKIGAQKLNEMRQNDEPNAIIDIEKEWKERISYITIDTLDKELEVIFDKISGQDRYINATELKNILNAILSKDSQCVNMKNFDGFSIDDGRSIVALYDKNLNGKMEFAEFITLFTNLRIWKTVFKESNIDNNGVLNSVEYRKALSYCGFSVDNCIFKVIINRFADPETGDIRFEDFIRSLIRLSNSFEIMKNQPRDILTRIVFNNSEFIAFMMYT